MNWFSRYGGGRRRITALIAITVLAASCTSPGAETTTTGAQTTTSDDPATPTTSQTVTTTTGPPFAANPLTSGVIDEDLLAMMPLPELDTPFKGFAVAASIHETNDIVVATVRDSGDEADDVERYGRVDGYRTVHRPARLSTGETISIDTAVALFLDDQGASSYLADYARDVIKNLDTGRGGQMRGVEAREFAVDELADEGVGIIVSERDALGQSGFIETAVAFRLGRIIGFVQLLQSTSQDSRVSAAELAQDLEDRVRQVLAGKVTPGDDPAAAALERYAFTYRQILTEDYVQVVYPEIPPDEGGEDSTTTITGTTDPNAASSTTTTTLLVPITSVSEVETTGVATNGGLDCLVEYSSEYGLQQLRYLIVGQEGWRASRFGAAATDDPPDEFEPIDLTDETVAGDLIYCPGWSPILSASGLDQVVTPGRGSAETLDGMQAERFSLGTEALEAVGLAPQGGIAGLAAEFTVWIGGAGPWVVGLDMRLSGPSQAMIEALGPAFYPDGEVVIEVTFRMSRMNDTTLAVAPPAPAG